MEGRVKSHISNKTYITKLETIEDEDKDLKTELYMLPISGNKIMVAPGKSRMDESGIAFCYVYVIQRDKVVTKLGVYEKKSDSMPLIFDISTFPEGSFCLFEEFEKNPSKLLEFVMTQEKTVFDFLIDEFSKIEDKRKVVKSAYKTIYETFLKEENKNDKEMKPIMKVISAATKDKDSPVTDEFLYTLHDGASDKTVFVYTLLALQHVFNTEFRFKTDNEKYLDIAARWKIQDPNTTLDVDVDTYEIVKSAEVNLDKFTPIPEESEPSDETTEEPSEEQPDTKLDDSLPKESETTEQPDTKLDDSTPKPVDLDSLPKQELEEIPEETEVEVPDVPEEAESKESVPVKKTRKPRTPKSDTETKPKTKKKPIGSSLNGEPKGETKIKAPSKIKLKSKKETGESS
jgi:hypothetical protein